MLNSNDILGMTKYPDKWLGTPSSDPSEWETYTVNALGQRIALFDRNRNVHQYRYDVVGRQTFDAVTQFGAGVDDYVGRMETAYDPAGRPYLFTSYSAAMGGSVVNQVRNYYNGYGQLTAQAQAHAGEVTSVTPSVAYDYTPLSENANNSRLVSIRYPNFRVLGFAYLGQDDSISRVSGLYDNSTIYEADSYLGLGTLVQRSLPVTTLSYMRQPADSAYIGWQQGSATGEAGVGIYAPGQWSCGAVNSP